MRDRPSGPSGRIEDRDASDRFSLGLSDCRLADIMPPCWTQAYSGLLTLGETRPGFGRRIP